jgi:hypothetical protein
MRRPSAASQLVIGIAVVALFAVLLSQAIHPWQTQPEGTPIAYATLGPSVISRPTEEPSGGPASPTPRATQPSVAPASAPTAAATQPTPGPTGQASLSNGQNNLAELLALLPTQPEDRTGYRRDLFVHWIDANGDGCDTRHEVLIEQSLTPVTVGTGCSLSGGSWFSFYDGLTFTDPSQLDIDHMVPLAEAWDSGASVWSADRRERYANDLGVPWALIAVSASSNRSKGDSDPAEWMPPAASAECTYLAEWLAVKVRWRLAVDPAERAALSGMIGDCPTTTMSAAIAP